MSRKINGEYLRINIARVVSKLSCSLVVASAIVLPGCGRKNTPQPEPVDPDLPRIAVAAAGEESLSPVTVVAATEVVATGTIARTTQDTRPPRLIFEFYQIRRDGSEVVMSSGGGKAEPADQSAEAYPFEAEIPTPTEKGAYTLRVRVTTRDGAPIVSRVPVTAKAAEDG